jgi:periplasmic protein TonB
MFEDSLLEKRLGKKRKGATLVSFTIEALVVCILVLLPLVFPEAMPQQLMQNTFLAAPPPPPPPPPPPAAAVQVVHIKPVSEIVNGALRTPTKIPDKVQMLKEDESVNAGMGGGVPGGVPGGVAGGSIGGVIGGIIGGSAAAVPLPKVAAPTRPVRVSQGVFEGLRLVYVKPVYPALARQARVSGSVVLQAIISRDGTIQNLHVVTGHPMLIQNAMDAVKQWRYRPYLLNGEPVEVETQITVNFTLSGS